MKISFKKDSFEIWKKEKKKKNYVFLTSSNWKDIEAAQFHKPQNFMKWSLKQGAIRKGIGSTNMDFLKYHHIPGVRDQ